MKGTTLAWLAFIGAATWRWEQSSQGTLPPPSIYVGAAGIYSLLGLLAGPAPQFATALGWAVVVGALTTGMLLPPINAQGGVGSKQYGPAVPKKGNAGA